MKMYEYQYASLGIVVEFVRCAEVGTTYTKSSQLCLQSQTKYEKYKNAHGESFSLQVFKVSLTTCLYS